MNDVNDRGKSMAQRDYRGPERRRIGERREFCLQVDKIEQLERMCRENSHGLRQVTLCLEGYKGFIDLLKRRETQRAELRQKMIDTIISRGVFGALVAIGLLIWAGFKNYVKFL
jgi:hypothetical protein